MSARLTLLDKMIAKGTTDPFVFYARAMELRSDGDNAAALLAFEDVTTRFPSYVPTYLMAAQLALELGKQAEARQLLERGSEVAQSAGDDHALSELGKLLQSL